MSDVAAIYRISEGTEGVRETMVLMRAIVRQYRENPFIVQTAREIVSGLPEKALTREARAIFTFVQDSIRYVLDPNGVETLATPDYLLRHRSGDCDDKSILLAVLLECVGIPTRFKAVGFNGGELSHVYVESKIGDDWIPMDSTERLPMGELAFDPESVKNKWIVHN